MSDDKFNLHINTLFNLLTAQGDGAYIGESISQLEHSLQAAHFATLDKSTPETIIAALLHDIGQFIPLSTASDMLDENGHSVGRKAHDKLGAEYLRQNGWPNTVYELVGAHVEAKRYLSTEEGYLQGLSRASKASLKAQGGPFSEEEKKRFEEDKLWKDMLKLRTYDDRSKVVGLEVMPLEGYRSMAEGVLRRAAQK